MLAYKPISNLTNIKKMKNKTMLRFWHIDKILLITKPCNNPDLFDEIH